MKSDISPFGAGLYTAADAARLLHIKTQDVRRWLGGYASGKGDKKKKIKALWQPTFIANDDFELGFRDLTELRFVVAFKKAGVPMQTIRTCLKNAKNEIGEDRPFSTQRFKTDGKRIFLASIEETGEIKTLDLKNNQYVFNTIIEQTFKDFDIEDGSIKRWRPFDGKESIIIDPDYVFGQPMISKYHIPTIALAQAVEAEGSAEKVAKFYEIELTYVHDAVAYEQSLAKNHVAMAA